MKFKRSPLLILLTLFCVVLGLGYQVHLLRQQVADLKKDIETLQQRPANVLIHNMVPQPNDNGRQPSRLLPKGREPSRSPFRLLNSETVVDPEIEDGMRASEWEMQQLYLDRLREMEPQPQPESLKLLR